MVIPWEVYLTGGLVVSTAGMVRYTCCGCVAGTRVPPKKAQQEKKTAVSISQCLLLHSRHRNVP